MAYQSKDPLVLARQLAVQELNLTSVDVAIAVANGADTDIQINEPVKTVHQVIHIASAGTVTSVAAANLTIQNSVSGVTNGAFKVVGKLLAAGDKLSCRYELTK